jgi:hypothetical protein
MSYRITSAAAIALSLSVTGCFIPVHYTERATPPLTGQFLRSDGTPAAGIRVAVANGYDNASCKRPRLQTTVDSAGGFVLPGTTNEVRWVLIMPAVDRFGSSYLLCTGSGDGTLRPTYQGFSSFDEHAPGDTISCLEWDWQGQVRMTCSKSSRNVIVTGGHWATASAEGFYRLILTKEGPITGFDGQYTRPRLVVQWVETPAADRRTIVRAAAEVPSGDKYRKLRTLKDPRLWVMTYAWCLSVESNRSRFLDPGDERLWFELGPPGDVLQVAECGQRPPNAR